jgi:hypothetical protein
LTDAGEILLLAPDDRTAAIKPLPERALRYAPTGALLMQQAIANPFETDPDGLHPIDGNENPDSDETAPIALVDVCRWFDGLSTEKESSRLRPRIDRWIKLGSIGREVAPSVEEISRAMAGAMPTIMERRRMRNRRSAARWRRASTLGPARECNDGKVVS